jgi:cyanophycinase
MAMASAFERPDHVAAQCVAQLTRVGVTAVASGAMKRSDATSASVIEEVKSCSAVVMTDGSSMHLRSALKDTALWNALVSVLAGGGTLVLSGAAAVVATDPMFDERGGAFTLGLGLVSPLAVMAQHETWTPERSRRVRELAPSSAPVAALDTESALVWTDGHWSAHGSVSLSLGAQPIAVSDLPQPNW